MKTIGRGSDVEDGAEAASESDMSVCLFGSQPLSQDAEGSVKSATSTPRVTRKKSEPQKPLAFPDPDLSAIEEQNDLEKSDPSDTMLIEGVLNDEEERSKLNIDNELQGSKPLSEISNRGPGSPMKNSTRIDIPKTLSESPGAPLKNSTRISEIASVKTQPTQKLNKFAKYKMIIVVSQLSRADKFEVEKLAKRENSIVVNSFNEYCTHVITSFEFAADSSRIAARSLKLIQGTYYF